MPQTCFSWKTVVGYANGQELTREELLHLGKCRDCGDLIYVINNPESLALYYASHRSELIDKLLKLCWKLAGMVPRVSG